MAADGDSNGRLGGEVDQPSVVTGTAEGSGPAPDSNEHRSSREVRLSRFVVTDFVAKAIPARGEEVWQAGESIDGLGAAAEADPVAVRSEQLRVDDGQVHPPSDSRTPAQRSGGLRGSRRRPIGVLGRFVRRAAGGVRRGGS